MNLKTVCVGVALLATSLSFVPTPSDAQVTNQGGKYLFRVNWVKGKVYKWTVATSVTPPGAAKPMAFNTTYSATVKDVQKGVASVSFLTGAMPGQAAPKPTLIKLDNRGKVVGGGAAGVENVQAQMPAGPIAVGGKWSSSQKMGAGPAAGMTVTTNYTFKGVKTVKGKQVAEIATTTKMSGSAQMSGTGSGTMQVDMADGQLRSFVMSQNLTMKQGTQNMKLPMKVTISRS